MILPIWWRRKLKYLVKNKLCDLRQGLGPKRYRSSPWQLISVGSFLFNSFESTKIPYMHGDSYFAILNIDENKLEVENNFTLWEPSLPWDSIPFPHILLCCLLRFGWGGPQIKFSADLTAISQLWPPQKFTQTSCWVTTTFASKPYTSTLNYLFFFSSLLMIS